MTYVYEREKYYRDSKKYKVVQYLLDHPCVDCGEVDVRVLDFDHVRGTKTGCVGELVRSGNLRWERVEEEIKKCEVRCANCHRKKTIGCPLWFTDIDAFKEGLKNLRKLGFKGRQTPPCGTRRKYRRGCRCKDCRKANADYNRSYSRKWKSRRSF